MIQLFETVITDVAKACVNKVLDSTWLNEGKYVRLFEEDLESRGFTNPLTVNSCTSALHLSLIVAGVKQGDEVILPAQTFLATGMVVLQIGAIPVFVDINPQTGNIEPNCIKEKITDKTKAIIGVHWGGSPCDLKEIYEIANGIPVIDDAAHAFGASYQGKPIGGSPYSDYTCFSLQAIKNLTSGDGGIICAKDPEKFQELKRRKWFGLDRDNVKRRFEGDREPSITEIGYKYHMNDIAGALAFGNMHGYDDRLEQRRTIAKRYIEELKIPGIGFLKANPSEHAYWVFTMLVENRKDFIRKLRDSSVSVSVMDRRIDELPVFDGITDNLYGQELFDQKQVSIPVHHKLFEEQVDYIINTIKSGW